MTLAQSHTTTTTILYCSGGVTIACLNIASIRSANTVNVVSQYKLIKLGTLFVLIVCQSYAKTPGLTLFGLQLNLLSAQNVYIKTLIDSVKHPVLR